MCALSKLGPPDLAASMPELASALYSKNISALLELMLVDGALAPDFSDEVLAASCVTRETIGNLMIATLFRTLATPLAVFLDYVMVPRRTVAYLEYIDEYGDDLDFAGHREVT
ncbi:hypothetical protein AZG88_18930 [Rhodococcus sp. LB1]|nr:hypothetical protein AZG88_18930 [Rhodococcus sp. LB1]